MSLGSLHVIPSRILSVYIDASKNFVQSEVRIKLKQCGVTKTRESVPPCVTAYLPRKTVLVL